MKLNARRSKGFRAERELVESLSELGFFSVRIPVSAVRTVLPDVIVFHSGRIYGFEVKSTGQSKITYYRGDFDNLVEWHYKMVLEAFSCDAFLAVRFRGGVWRFYSVDNQTEKVTCDRNSGLGFKDLVKKIRGEA